MDDVYKSFELDRDSRRYIHVKLNHVIKTYDSKGRETTKSNLHNVVRCDEKMFKSGSEKQYFGHMKD